RESGSPPLHDAVPIWRRDAARVGLGGERVAPALALLQQDVDVLAGKEAEVLVHRQAQPEHRDVGRGLVEALDEPAPDVAGPGVRGRKGTRLNSSHDSI